MHCGIMLTSLAMSLEALALRIGMESALMSKVVLAASHSFLYNFCKKYIGHIYVD